MKHTNYKAMVDIVSMELTLAAIIMFTVFAVGHVAKRWKMLKKLI